MNTCIVNGVRSEWTLANNKNNELCNVVFGDNVARLTQAEYRRYYSTNGKALDAFLARKEAGLSLSDRVWRYSDTFRNEIEMGLDIGIRSGLDAPAMARELQTYLQHPDKLFRRVADEHGHLHLSKAAAAFHPGRGVYRSSYMNARRLAATETNIAYRTADHLRWQQMDFVVGIRVQLSNNHNCRGVPEGAFFDICDELKGDYPKDFKFTGWHPHCRCYATPILKTPEELAADNQRIMQGEEPAEESENAVADLPENFNAWLDRNEERIARAKSLPYFLNDNDGLINAQFAYSSNNAGTTWLVSRVNSLANKLAKPAVGENEALEWLDELVANNPMHVRGQFKGFKVDRYNPENSFMRTSISGIGAERISKIRISNETFMVASSNGTKIAFNPMRELQGAIEAIRKGELLTMQQEYALECVWHELRHAKAKGWRDLKQVKKNPHWLAVMETINQFCARRTYPKLLKQIGIKANHLETIIQGGYGYGVEVKNFMRLLSHYGIDDNEVLRKFERSIVDSDYDEIFGSVERFLKLRGIKNAGECLRLLSESVESFAKKIGD